MPTQPRSLPTDMTSIEHHYHQVIDEPQYIDCPDLARVTRVVYSAAMVIANMPHRPTIVVATPAAPRGRCRQ